MATKKRGGRGEARFVGTTVLFTPEQHTWVRQEALARASVEGGKPDGSRVIRELVDRAMKRTSRRAE
jgi:hypothetical protein